MQMDIVVLVTSSFVFAFQITPLVVIVATAIRSIVLLTGRRRAFVTWTRNSLLSAISIIFAPGMMINTGVRYGICSLFGIDMDGIGANSTYAELNLFLRVERPPRVWVLVTALFLSTVLSVFIGFVLIVLPMVIIIGAPLVLVCWYVAVCVLFNTSIRGGDVTLLGAALKGHPGKGILELVVTLSIIVFLYIALSGVLL
ncbi:MAG: conserved membrane protein of unknown function [Candidatus Thorarchaeota archaeon]|nr:MAG: conserved membrane protein of unknown function [Candidatus Thorarchaeota archaeon]